MARRAPPPEYSRMARYYDQVYSWKDYAEEARRITALVRRWGRSNSRTLLDVGCGTGTHLALLQGRFRCTGVERNDAMLRVARRKSRAVRWVHADMERLELGEPFDIVTCLFGAIGYVGTVPRLRRMMQRLARHVRPGGLLVIDPWLTPQNYQDGHLSLTVHDAPGLKIARAAISRREGRRSTIEFGYVVGASRAPLRLFRETHRLGLFSVAEILAALSDAGFRGRFYRKGFSLDRGLYVAVREGLEGDAPPASRRRVVRVR
ncbi:MAG: class I SAM-dependent methyltransferase [Thermoplasmata archaeon]|nr:class I SAM-dependent methyltransferase [Thermoplasmata archaeon]